MQASTGISRRDLLKAGGAIVVSFAFQLTARDVFAQTAPRAGTRPVDSGEVDGLLAIHADGSVTLYTSKVDVGTGIRIAFAQMAAEELGVSPSRVTVVEGDKKREQAYEGVVIARRNRGLNSSFIVRKISTGEGVERTFQTYAPSIASIEIKRKGDVRRSKLYYLRGLTGKAARIREKLTSMEEREVLPPLEEGEEAAPEKDAKK